MFDKDILSLQNTDDNFIRKLQSTVPKATLERIGLTEWANVLFGKEVQNRLIVKKFGTTFIPQIKTKISPKKTIIY